MDGIEVAARALARKRHASSNLRQTVCQFHVHRLVKFQALDNAATGQIRIRSGMKCRTNGMVYTGRVKETFIGESITPVSKSIQVSSTLPGEPLLPTEFKWHRQRISIAVVLEKWKEAGDCHHGSGERYVRKHWYRVRTQDGLEMKIYFERQPRRGRSSSRWRLYTVDRES